MYCATGSRSSRALTRLNAAEIVVTINVKTWCLIRQIRSLLYEHGFTIGGAKQRLEGETSKKESTPYNQLVAQTISELEDILESLTRK